MLNSYPKVINRGRVRWQENNSFRKKMVEALACAFLRDVLFCGRGFLFFFAGGRKNKINSPQIAPPYQRSTNPVNPFFVIISILIYRINVSSWWFSTLAYNSPINGVLLLFLIYPFFYSTIHTV